MSKLKDLIEFCNGGYTMESSIDGRRYYEAVHTATGKRTGGKTREAAERDLVKLNDNELKVQGAIIFLKEQGYFISKPM